jgi:hypothetical protein
LAPTDPAEEALLALLREEIRAGRRAGGRIVIVAEVVMQAGRIVTGYVQPPRKTLDAVDG